MRPTSPYRSCNIVLRQMRFHYLEWGAPDAPPIVLLHGGHQSAHSWDLVSLHLAQRYRVLALDQRGHGDSEWARDVEYSNHAMSLDAEAFIDAMGLRRPILIGHSMGGRNSMLLTRRDPSRLRALVIVDVGPELSDRGPRGDRRLRAGQPGIRRPGAFRRATCGNTIPTAAASTSSARSNTTCCNAPTANTSANATANPRRLGMVRGIGPLENITLDDAQASICRCCWCAARTPASWRPTPRSGSATPCRTALW